jgi:hypothetical protein
VLELDLLVSQVGQFLVLQETHCGDYIMLSKFSLGPTLLANTLVTPGPKSSQYRASNKPWCSSLYVSCSFLLTAVHHGKRIFWVLL